MSAANITLEENEYRSKLEQAGFVEVRIDPTRVYHLDDAREFLTGRGVDVDALAKDVDGRFLSALIRAKKPLIS